LVELDDDDDDVLIGVFEGVNCSLTRLEVELDFFTLIGVSVGFFFEAIPTPSKSDMIAIIATSTFVVPLSPFDIVIWNFFPFGMLVLKSTCFLALLLQLDMIN